MNAASARPGRASRWQINASYVAALGMIICFAAVLLQFLRWVDPSMDGRGMLVACGLAALEAFFSFWLINQLATARNQAFLYRGTEVVILLIILKFFTELRAGTASFWNNFLLWPVDFPFNLLNWHFILTSLAVLAAWWAGNLFAADLALLGADDEGFPDERLKTATVRTLIQRRFLRLGLLVVFLAAIPAQTALVLPLPVASNGVPAALVYFVLGIILLSLTRYISLENGWTQDKLKVPIQIPRRWFAYSALILVLLVLLISLLPTNYGLGFFATLMAVFHLLAQLVLDIFFLIQLMIALIAHLLGQNTVIPQNASPQINLPTPQPLPASPPGVFNWGLVQSILIWGILVVLAVLALRQYIAFNRDLSEELRRFRPLRWLVNAWQRFKASFRKTNQAIGTFVQQRLQRLRRLAPDSALASGDWDYVNPRRLSPRQKVIFYYLALVRRAQEAGLSRQANQTPYEYAQALASQLSEEKEGLDNMTEAFIEARYSRHDIPAQAAHRTESIWEAIRRALKKVRKASLEKKPPEK
jgi:Domain of unknown function (DUF4129)